MNRISGDLALIEALRSLLGMSAVSTEDLSSHVSVTNNSVTSSLSSQSATGLSVSTSISVSTSMDQQCGAANIQLVDNSHQFINNDSPLAVRVHQLGAYIYDPLAGWLRQGDVNDGVNPNGGIK